MFKLVFLFGLMVVSTTAEDTSHSRLSRHAELRKPSNQSNQTITQQQEQPNSQDPRTQTGNEPLIWFLKWSLTNYTCPPMKQMKTPCGNEDLAMSVSATVKEKDGNQNKFDKMMEVKTSHPKRKREATIPRNELNLLDDRIENKVKASHTSHIYIGESMYPYIYEESRIFKSEPPNPSSGENPPLKEVKISETRPKEEEEVPVYEITKIYEIK